MFFFPHSKSFKMLVTGEKYHPSNCCTALEFNKAKPNIMPSELLFLKCKHKTIKKSSQLKNKNVYGYINTYIYITINVCVSN